MERRTPSSAGPPRRRLIVNADDFGMSPGVNAGIALAARDGILASATLMANGPFFAEAVDYARDLPGLGVGIHLNLVRGQPLSPPGEIPRLVRPDGRLRPFRLKARPDGEFLGQAEREYRRQFEKTLAAGISPSHIDFEKHHPWQAALYLLACRLAGEYGVPAVRNLREPLVWAVRRLGWPGWRRFAMAAGLRAGLAAMGARTRPLATPDRFLGQSHIGGMTEAIWLRLVRHLPPGTSEVMTHPALPDDPADPRLVAMESGWLGEGRQRELAALLSERVRRAVKEEGIELISFSQICPNNRKRKHCTFPNENFPKK